AYWSFGQFWGVVTILLIEFQAAHGLSDAAIGGLLALLSGAAILTMLLLVPRVQHWPLSVSVPFSLAILAVGAVAFGAGPDALLPVAAVVVGAGNGLIDIYLNVAGQRVEERTRRPVLQWLHACYALGGATGAAVAGILRTANVDYRAGFLYAAAALALTTVWNRATAPRERGVSGDAGLVSVSALRRSPVLWIPAIALLGAFLVEGSLDVWSGAYVREDLQGSAMAAAYAFMAFSLSAFVGRLFAGRVLFGLGRGTTILVSGVGTALAGFVAVTTHSTAVVAGAFLVMGFALSAAAPASFGLTGLARDEDPSAAIAAVTTVGYTGFIWSPPVIGWLAGAWGLRAGMAFVVVCSLLMVVAGMLAPRDAERP
ncbi:MAG: MFS transporter, partial [Planctomycetaceae bacterium]